MKGGREYLRDRIDLLFPEWQMIWNVFREQNGTIQEKRFTVSGFLEDRV